MFQRLDRSGRRRRQHAPRTVMSAALLFAVALVGASCGNDTESMDSSNDSEPAATEATTETTTAPEGGDAVDFMSPDGYYTVKFPAEPAADPVPLEIPDGRTIELPRQVAADGSSEYTASALAYPDDVDMGEPDDLLDGVVEGAVSALPGGLLGESEEVEVNGKQGRRFEFTVAQGTGEAVFVVDGQVLFHAIAVGDADDSDAHTAFVDSFEVL